MSRRTTAALAATVATLVLVGFAAGFLARPPIQRWTERLKGSLAQAARQKHLQAAFIGRPASDLPVPTLDGNTLRLSEKKGKVILLVFWASWCSYSRAALPAIQAIHERYAGRSDFEIIGVSLDRDREELNRFLAGQGIRWVNLYEDGRAWKSLSVTTFEVRAIPSRWIIGKDSTIAAAELSQDAAEDALSLLLENRHRDPPPTGGRAPVFASGGCVAVDAP